MNIFLFIVSILIYTTYSLCDNTHSQSTLFSISINRAVSSVKEGGITNYVDIIKQAADAILPASSNIAVATFGGVNGVDPAYISKTSGFISGAYADIESYIDSIASDNFGSNWGNAVADAFKLALDPSHTWSGQKYHILFSSSNPIQNGFGTSSSPEYFNNPCIMAVAAKQQNIQTYVVLIGTQGMDYVKEYFQCIVEDKTLDIIELDPSNSTTGLIDLRNRVCKTDGIDVKITEVSPVAGYYHPYIEVLNRGSAASISACFVGAGTCSNAQLTPTGDYFVAYGTGGSHTPGTVSTCSGGACYQNGLGTTVASWVARARVGVADVQTVTKDGSFQAHVTTHSYALRAVGFNNNYGANWRMSCDLGGTPGSKPLDVCPTSGSCVDAECTAGGGNGCETGNSDYCDCLNSATLLSDADTCIAAPSILTSCVGYVIADRVGTDWSYLAWDIEYDGIVSQQAWYPTDSVPDPDPTTNDPQTNSIISGGLSVMATSTLKKTSGSATIKIFTKTSSSPGDVDQCGEISAGGQACVATNVDCAIATLNPTISPSKSPSKAPSNNPSVSPTLAPTYDDPGVFISSTGVCTSVRCTCFENVRACCTPFGPEYDAITLTGGLEPNRGCPSQFKTIEISPEQQKSGLQESIYFGKYGATHETQIHYTMRAYGQINKTDFEDLNKWTDYYTNSGVTPAPTVISTPAPSIAGNKLNIDVFPPGPYSEFNGILIVPSGETQTILKVNISSATLNCVEGEDCTTYEECQETAMGFMLIITSCSTSDPTLGNSCSALYPSTLWISVTRNNALCGIVFGVGSQEDELPDWFWWVLIALILFLLLLAWLVYRFWWKQKKATGELGDAEDELDQQHADNEAGFGAELDVGDVQFNPVATGVPGVTRPADAFGNEIYQRQKQQENEYVDVQAEVFRVRQDFGQVSGNRNQNQNQNQGY